MIDGVILYIELVDPERRGEAPRADERREPGVEPRPRLPCDWQELAIAPQVRRPALDNLARKALSHERVVVHRFERPKALATDP